MAHSILLQRSKMGDTTVSVTVTPNGFADAVVSGEWFVTPLELQMKFSEFVDLLEKGGSASFPIGVYYIQKQNSNFTTAQYEPLVSDAETHIP